MLVSFVTKVMLKHLCSCSLLTTLLFGEKVVSSCSFVSASFATSHALLPPSFCAALSPNIGHQPRIPDSRFIIVITVGIFLYHIFYHTFFTLRKVALKRTDKFHNSPISNNVSIENFGLKLAEIVCNLYVVMRHFNVCFC